MLAAGTAAQAGFSALTLGLPVLAPALRDEYGLGLAQLGVVLASEWVGTVATLLAWGLLADRVGERAVLAAGLGGCGLLLVAAAHAPGFASLVALLALAGAAGASVNSASGRAVMHWFGPEQRGLALGLRQTAIPLGGLAGALALPHLDARGGLLFLAALCLGGAAVGGLVLRDGRAEAAVAAGDVPWTLRDRRLWRLCWGSGLILVAQVAVLGFLVLFLHDERGLSTSSAAAVLVAVNLGAAALRIGAGRLSDVLRSRVRPLRWAALAVAAALALATALAAAPVALAVSAFALAGALSMAWNGLSFAAAAELAGRARSGAAIGFQQTVLSVVGAAVPPAFAVLAARLSWTVAFGLAAAAPLAGWWLLRPLRDRG